MKGPFADAVGYLLWFGVVAFVVSLVGGGTGPIAAFIMAAPVVLIAAAMMDRLS